MCVCVHMCATEHTYVIHVRLYLVCEKPHLSVYERQIESECSFMRVCESACVCVAGVFRVLWLVKLICTLWTSALIFGISAPSLSRHQEAN